MCAIYDHFIIDSSMFSRVSIQSGDNDISKLDVCSRDDVMLLTITGDLFHYTKVEIDHNEKARTIIYASTAYTLGILSLLLTLTIMIWLISAIVMYGL